MGKKEGDNFKGNQVKFGEGQPTNLGGRKPSTLTTFIAKLKEEGYEKATAKDVVDAYEYLIALPIDKLNELANDNKQPILIKHLAFLLHSKDNKRAFDIMEKMLDRAQGKAISTQVVVGDMKIENNENILSDMTNEKLERLRLAVIENNTKAD